MMKELLTLQQIEEELLKKAKENGNTITQTEIFLMLENNEIDDALTDEKMRNSTFSKRRSPTLRRKSWRTKRMSMLMTTMRKSKTKTRMKTRTAIFHCSVRVLPILRAPGSPTRSSPISRISATMSC